MNLIVTGSSSYIGAVLVPMLKDHRVFSYDVKNGFDICDEQTLAPVIENAEAIIHLAAAATPALCEKHPEAAQHVNVDAVRLINKLRGSKPIFFPNTNIGYGAQIRQDIYDETSPMHPTSVYGKTKCEGERLILEAGNCVVFRLASLFGWSNTMRWNLLLNYMVKEAYGFHKLKIYEGHVRRNFLHVKDICRAFMHAIDNYDSMKNQVYNAGLGLHPTKIEMANMIKEYIPEIVIEEVAGSDPDKRDYFISSEKLMATGWQPQFSIQDGIRELIECLKS